MPFWVSHKISPPKYDLEHILCTWFNAGMNRRQIFATLTAGGFACGLRLPAASGEISRTAESIHQEPAFQASRKRVYDLLLTAREFDNVVRLSDAAKSMGLQITPATISSTPGGAFSLFGGYITGRQIELTANERIVQAWRTASWPSGVYSIVTITLVNQDGGTKIVFDHAGFPAGQAEHLAEGWHVNYWQPMTKVLAALPGA
jgi:activator of HSP90 ATPase